jgi:putative transposase
MAKKVVQQRSVSLRVVCAAFSISQSCCRHESKQSDQNQALANGLIQLKDHKRTLRFGPRRRLVRQKPEPLTVPQAIDQFWSMDFMHDKLEDVETCASLT